MNTATRFLIGLFLVTGVACTVKDTPAPPLTGPSELALRIAMTAIPDSILQDGASQTAIQIEVTGPDGRPVRGLTLRVEIEFLGVVEDFGTLSAKTVVTGDDGRARLTYTAPPRPSQPVDEANVVTIRVTPIGSDFRGETPRTIDVRLVTPGVLLPPNAGPVARFTSTPAAPAVLTNVIFDASTSTDEGAPCGAACTYTWDFGDGTTGTGIFVTHAFRTSGTFQVRLTVTDARGAAGSTAVPISVGAGTPPTAGFTFSPPSPAVNQTIFFTAESSTAATGRTIVSYEWNFGDGTGSSGVTTTKSYSRAGDYVVILTVTDDAGQRSTTGPRTVTVGAGGTATPRITFSPENPAVNQAVFFSGQQSTAGTGRRIVSYEWAFDDGTTATGVTVSKTYTAAGTYGVILTVVDDVGQRFTSDRTNVTVGGAGTGPQASLSVSPTSGGTTATNFFFDASASRPGPSPIVEYRFNFGDNSAEVVTTSPTTTHQFSTPGSYRVTVTVRDSAGRTSIASVTVAVS